MGIGGDMKARVMLQPQSASHWTCDTCFPMLSKNGLHRYPMDHTAEWPFTGRYHSYVHARFDYHLCQLEDVRLHSSNQQMALGIKQLVYPNSRIHMTALKSFFGRHPWALWVRENVAALPLPRRFQTRDVCTDAREMSSPKDG